MDKLVVAILVCLISAFNASAQNADGKIIAINWSPVLPESRTFSKGIDPRISYPIVITLTGLVVGAGAGFGIGYWEGRKDHGYEALHGLAGMVIGIPIGLAGGLTIGIVAGKRQYRRMNSPEKEPE
jgi:hypothetical protein